MLKDPEVIKKLEVPIIVQVGCKTLPLGDVMAFIPGTILELPKRADEELELLVNNRSIGTGVAVKVGENFGLQIAYVGDVKARIAAMGGQGPEVTAEPVAEATAPMASPETPEAAPATTPVAA